MKKRILIPTDFSKNAWNAVAYAADLYKREEVDFYLLHAYGDSQKENTAENSEKEFKKIMQHLAIKTIYQDHTYFTISLKNSLLLAIKQTVESKDIEIVVMGTKGETDSTAVFYGSNTIAAMEQVRNCPVMAIPRNIVYQDPNEIVFPTSFKTHFKRRELKHLFEISRITNAPVRILHIVKEKGLTSQQNSNKNLLEDSFDGLDYSFHWLENVEVQEGLFNFVTERSSGMIAFINKKHLLFGRIFSNPMVKQLGIYATVPVLALHDLRN